MTVPAQTEIAPPARKIQLHPLSRRVMHWINAAAIIVMIASGWRIYDSNPFPELPIHIGFPLNWTLGGYFPIDEAANNDDGFGDCAVVAFRGNVGAGRELHRLCDGRLSIGSFSPGFPAALRGGPHARFFCRIAGAAQP